jgi:hypothetical protein
MSLPWQALIDLRVRDVIGDAAFQSAERDRIGSLYVKISLTVLKIGVRS